jgi:putative transposase
MAKKNFRKGRDLKELKTYVSSNEKLSMRIQCELLGINRSSFYYQPKGESSENLQVMRLMDEHNIQHPTHGILQMQDFLQNEHQITANYKRVQRLLRLMGIMAVYPKRNLSKLGHAKYIRPYLLRGLKIDHPNQVWAIDITYIPMAKGFMYLIAIIDVFSRYVVAWDVYNSLDAENALNLLKSAIAKHGKPKIINSDQGSQFTCAEWINYLTNKGIKISMDGKGRAIDNIYIERLWRTVKQDYVYLNPASDGLELYQGLKRFFTYYNTCKSHQGIDRQIPINKYKGVA